MTDLLLFELFILLKHFIKFPFIFYYDLLVIWHLRNIFAPILVRLYFPLVLKFPFEFEFERRHDQALLITVTWHYQKVITVT